MSEKAILISIRPEHVFALITLFVLLVILLIELAFVISMLIGEYKKWKRKEKNGENDFDA